VNIEVTGIEVDTAHAIDAAAMISDYLKKHGYQVENAQASTRIING
jgi:hypothetical protein